MNKLCIQMLQTDNLVLVCGKLSFLIYIDIITPEQKITVIVSVYVDFKCVTMIDEYVLSMEPQYVS